MTKRKSWIPYSELRRVVTKLEKIIARRKREFPFRVHAQLDKIEDVKKILAQIVKNA